MNSTFIIFITFCLLFLFYLINSSNLLLSELGLVFHNFHAAVIDHSAHPKILNPRPKLAWCEELWVRIYEWLRLLGMWTAAIVNVVSLTTIKAPHYCKSFDVLFMTIAQPTTYLAWPLHLLSYYNSYTACPLCNI